MHYELSTEPGMRFPNVKTARKRAIDSFAYWRDMGVANPYITVYEGNYVGRWEIGVVYKGPGYPVYKTLSKDQKTYRISPSGDVRAIGTKKKKTGMHPFGL